MDYNEPLTRLREAVATGGAVCLLGAGFSIAAKDQSNLEIPSSSELVNELKNLLGIDHDDPATLTDIADFAEDSSEHQRNLRLLLINRLTLTHPSPEQKLILNQPWRSIFTTNFDDVVERSIDPSHINVITPSSRTSGRPTSLKHVYYLHGRAKDLVETDNDPRFVISERNYLNLHSDNRDLYSQLKNELFAAKLIVIIGYSMRDLEVARMLIEPGHAFHNKTMIICSASEKPLALNRLKKFGSVIPIGVEGLALQMNDPSPDYNSAQFNPQFIEIDIPTAPSPTIDGSDFVKLILTGNFRPDKYHNQLQGISEASELYSIRRSAALDTIVNRPATGANRFVISSDLGNGKTVFLDQLSIELMSTGYKVIRISSSLNEVFEELDKIFAANQPTAFLIDDVIRYRIIARYIGARLNSLSVLACCVRGAPEEVGYQTLTASLGGAVKQIDLNKISLDELRNWDVALERWGLWEERIQLPRSERISFLQKECGGENRAIVLSIFRSSYVASRIDQIVSFFVRSGAHRVTFAALLTSSLCQQHVSWESIVSWLDIDEQSLRNDISNSEIADIFGAGRNWNAFTSPQLAEYILRTRYVSEDKDALVDVFSKIVLCTADSATDGRLGSLFRENLKELMKFRFMTRLFGDDVAAMKLINRVYTRLSKAKLIRGNPQFWLQYAMSRMEVSDLLSAETYLNTAFGLAKERGEDYSPFQIIDQRSRLYFRKNTGTPGKFSSLEIQKATSDLNELLDYRDSEIIYLFRSTPFIRNFVDDQIDHLDQDLKASILSLLKRIMAAGEGYHNLPKSKRGESLVLRKALQDTVRVLEYA